jgi:two-component system sensor histidine kinase/response regulator
MPTDPDEAPMNDPADPVRILAVNDRADQLLVTSQVLAPLGHEVITCMSGADALRHLLAQDFSVILLDVNMPGMDGLELATHIRNRPRSASTPVIFITATSPGDLASLRGYEAGGFDYLMAPINPEVLRAKVAAFVRMHQMTEQIRQQARQLAAINEDLTTKSRQLELSNQELESFSYSVSHDLRAPLRHITNYAAILNEDHAARLDDDGRHVLGRVREAAARMSLRIEDLLNLSRVTRSHMSRGLVDLSAVAEATYQTLRQGDPQRQVDLTISPGLLVQADRGLMRALLDNLLGNAWKFTGKRVPARITIGRMATPRSRDTYFVRDNGAGFDMAYADKLFGVFQRLHSSDDFPGTGIGLSIVARIVHRHGGEIWAESQVDQGATFYFTLPSA